MTTRHLIAYALIVLLLAGAAVAIWRTIYNSEHNVRRRERRARHERHRRNDTGSPADDADIA